MTWAVAWLNRYASLLINPRQRTALAYLYRHKQITNPDYCRLNNVDSLAATRELRGLVEAGAIAMHGTRRWSHYVLAENRSDDIAATGTIVLKKRQQMVLAHLHKTGKITTAEYIELVGEPLSERTSERDLRQMESLGLIRRAGKARDIHYVLVE